MAINEIVLLIISMIFVDNIVLSKGLGVCPAISYGKTGGRAFGLGMVVTFAMIITVAVAYPIEKFVLFPFELEYMQTMVYVPIVFTVGYGVSKIMAKLSPRLHEELGCTSHLITTNCAILGVALIIAEARNTFLESIIVAAGTGIGFALAMILFAATRSKIDASPLVPESFKGIPISLIALAVISLIFLSFAGVAIGIMGLLK